MEPTYEIQAIPSDVLAELRAKDDAGAAPRRVVHTEGGSPLRCCMERSEPGESLAFVSYSPLRRWARETGADPGAYDETGPVFIHPHDCGGWAGAPGGGYPDAMRGDLRVLRATPPGDTSWAARCSTPATVRNSRLRRGWPSCTRIRAWQSSTCVPWSSAASWRRLDGRPDSGPGTPCARAVATPETSRLRGPSCPPEEGWTARRGLRKVA